MKKQIFLEDEYSYDYELVDNTHYLYYANVENYQLNYRGSKALSIEDDGNGLKFNFYGANKLKSRLDYSQSVELEILLRIINEREYFISEKVRF